MTGLISSSPISTPPNTTSGELVSGRAGFSFAAPSPTATWRLLTTWYPAGTGIRALVSAEGHRWAIEDSFETTKNELGLDHNESRSWHGWHRHVSLVMLAFAMGRDPSPGEPGNAPKKNVETATPLIRWSIEAA